MKTVNLNELNLENIAQWPLLMQRLIVVSMSVVIVLLGYGFISKPNMQRYQVLKSEEQILKNTLNTRQQQAADLQAYRQQMNQINTQFALMLKMLPAKNEMPDLLDYISRKGLSLGLKFELFAPQTEIIHDFYIELPIKIALVGTYMQLASFVSEIAQMDRLVTLHEFNIEKANKNNADAALVMNITAKIYRYRLK